MGKLILYGIEASPPVRTVVLTLNALALDYDLKEVSPLAGEQNSEDFRKKNPQHTIPVLEDNGQYIWDSHAIAAYLVRKYAKNDALYPKDFYQRAVVDQRMHFDSGVLFPNMRKILTPTLKGESVLQENIDAVTDAYDFLEAFLTHDYLTGNTVTIADFSVTATLTSVHTLVPIDPAKTPKLAAWNVRMTKLPYYEKANGKGLGAFIQFVNSKIGKN